jgi:hypothetical protein
MFFIFPHFLILTFSFIYTLSAYAAKESDVIIYENNPNVV